MHLIKWVRKNERKLMTWVVILCMITFVGGSGLSQLLSYFGVGGPKKVATCFDNQKIYSADVYNALNELEVLRPLLADRFLLLKGGPFGQPDINARLLACLLFPNPDLAAQLRAQLRGMAQQGQVPFTLDDIESFFEESAIRPEIAWLLLNAEAQKTGIIISIETAKQVLRQAIPQLTGNQADAAQIVKAVVKQTNMSDVEIIHIFAKLLAVLNYAGQVTDAEDVTLPQIRAAVARNLERIDTEFVKLGTEQFLDKTTAPEPDQLTAQFEKFKNQISGRYSPDNPFGFGYQLPHRIQLEYFVLKNDDVAKIIAKPTFEEMENYYAGNISQFQQPVPADPNKPDAEQQTVTEPYAAVADRIYSTLQQEKTSKLVSLIYKDARDMLEAGFEKINVEKASIEQIQQAAPDYPTVAAKITEKYKIPVYTGKTGLLDIRAFNLDACLGSLRPATPTAETHLAEILFAVDKTGQKPRRIPGVVIPKLWENIGPLVGGFLSEQDNQYHRVMAVLRVTDTSEQQSPDSIDLTYSTEGINLDGTQTQKYRFSVKEQVISNLKTIQAFGIARSRADELVDWIQNENWQPALDKYNAAYVPASADPNSRENLKLKLESLEDRLIVSQLEIDNAFATLDINPASAGFIRERLTSNILNRRFYELLGENKQIGPVSKVLPFEPDPAVYIVKSVQRRPPTTKDLLENKMFAAYQINLTDSAGLGLIQFNPQNIVKRTNFKMLREVEPSAPMPEELPPIEDY